ncbi:heme/hemin ABC transporter substrate-binding protein [Dactylosporangium sp. CA-092794]|uniref:heme/hemin ABC transporter substrate-binding protein n=1 Tax=Dactylosporangium sp. CA-092794 TaxID=3239929 RepID=UPI003D948132
MSAVPRRAVVVVAAVLALAGCTAHAAPGPGRASDAGVDTARVAELPWSQVTPLADPKAYSGPSTAHLTDADIVPITADARPVLPATVTDNQGTRVTVTSVERILALDLYGTLAATVYGLGLGDRLAGRDQSTGFPAARHLPLVTGGAHVLNAEAILALHPTVVLTDTTLGPWDVILQLRDAGVPVVVTSSRRGLAGVGELTGQVAAALGVSAEGERLTARIGAEIDAVRAQIARIAPAAPDRRLRVDFLYARGQAGVFYLFGRDSGADSLIDALAAVDVATQAGLAGFTPLNAEALATTRPDVILMMTAGLESVGGVDGALKLPGVAQTPAGQHRRIVDMSDYQILSFGPLSARVLDALARALYAPASVTVSGAGQ